MFKASRLIFIFTVMLILVACGNKPEIEMPMSNKIPEFEAITQTGNTFTTNDYIGKWTVVDFIFTNCTSVCIPMSHNFSRLQDNVADEGLENVQFVSYSIDPDFDTPEVLSEYAKSYNADLSNWMFLTGYEFGDVKELAIKTFKTFVQEAQPGDDQVTHQTWFSLVNPEGTVVKVYGGVEAEDTDKIFDDLKVLTK